jgi:hypothetical protein
MKRITKTVKFNPCNLEVHQIACKANSKALINVVERVQTEILEGETTQYTIQRLGLVKDFLQKILDSADLIQLTFEKAEHDWINPNERPELVKTEGVHPYLNDGHTAIKLTGEVDED